VANHAAVHSVVSVAQFVHVAPGHFGSGGGSTSTHAFGALPAEPPLFMPPLFMPPLLVPPMFVLPLPATLPAPLVAPLPDPPTDVLPPAPALTALPLFPL